ncbi:hypothetical protein SO802_014548 [Lithocarpus litseifolius]|uniref:RNase III domain-containing protein n=1 Tax=Lithocarpus litseifolius TaxID=425828 RepID=A0AAW2CTF6_9ROSI
MYTDRVPFSIKAKKQITMSAMDLDPQLDIPTHWCADLYALPMPSVSPFLYTIPTATSLSSSSSSSPPSTSGGASDDMASSIRSVEEILSYRFKDKTLLEEALTHSSYNNGESLKSYQRLEFVGDAVLGLAVSNYVFLAYPNLEPGQLSSLRAANISTEKLARVAVRHGLHRFIRHNTASLHDKFMIYNFIRMVAIFIVQKILLDDVGLDYICTTAERFFAVGRVLGNMVAALAEQPSSCLLKHIIRCYLCLSDNPRACDALRSCLLDMLRDASFSSCLRWRHSGGFVDLSSLFLFSVALWWSDPIAPTPRPLIVIISSPCVVGKDVVINHLTELHQNLHFIVTTTSHAKWPDETEGKDYYFVTKEQFLRMVEQDELLKHVLGLWMGFVDGFMGFVDGVCRFC